MEKLTFFFVFVFFAGEVLGQVNNGDLDDLFGFQPGQFRPGQNQQNQFPAQNPFPGLFPGLRPSTTTAAPPRSTTLSSEVRSCMTSCPVTAEYNPVCGTDIVLYANPGRLSCAQACGVNVSLLRQGPCPPTTTAAPVPAK